MAARDTLCSLLVGLLVLLHTWGAWAIEVQMEDRVEVWWKDSANISCMFISDEGTGGMTIRWSYVAQNGDKKEIYYQDPAVREARRDTQFTERIYVTGPGKDGVAVLHIRDVEISDDVEFICIVKDLTGEVAEGRTRLKVFKTPGEPTIEANPIALAVSEYDPPKKEKIGLCETKNGYPKPNITWYRNRMPLRNSVDVEVNSQSTVGSNGLVSVSSELYKKVVKEDEDALFYCEVSYFSPQTSNMMESGNINISVQYPSTMVTLWVESPKGKIREGDTVKLRCKGNGNSPASISIGPNESEMEDTEEFKLINVTRQNSGTYYCTSMDMNTIEETKGSTTVEVNYLDPAVLMPNNIIVVAQGGELKATCNALSSLQTQTVWYKGGEEISRGHTLIKKNVTMDTAGLYKCVVTVPDIEGMETSATMRVHFKGPPRIMSKDKTELEKSFGSTVDLSCSVGGFPAPHVIWTTDDGKVLKGASQTETEDSVEGSVSFKVNSDITVSCNASNEYGWDALTFNVKATKHTTPTSATPTVLSTTAKHTTPTSATPTVLSTTVKAETVIPPKKIHKEGNGVVIAVIIIFILLLAILGSVLYFLYKTGRICGRSGKQDLTKDKSKDNIVVEMKSDNTEEAILLGVNGEKQPPSDQ